MIDCHCHLSDSRCFDRAAALIAEGQAQGVRTWVMGGTDSEEWSRQAALAEQFPRAVIQNYGIHPWQVEAMPSHALGEALDDLESCLISPVGPRARGLGETGLDFHSKRDPSKFADQKRAFARQLEIASDASLPLVLHVVKAFGETLDLTRGLMVPMMLHRFSGNEQQALAFLGRGAYLSFTGAFRDPVQGEKARKALLATPLNRLMLETDGPDLPFGDLPAIYAAAAKLHRVEVEVLVRQISDNVRTFYGLGE